MPLSPHYVYMYLAAATARRLTSNDESLSSPTHIVRAYTTIDVLLARSSRLFQENYSSSSQLTLILS